MSGKTKAGLWMVGLGLAAKALDALGYMETLAGLVSGQHVLSRWLAPVLTGDAIAKPAQQSQPSPAR